MDRKFIKKLNKLVDQVAETTKDTVDVGAEASKLVSSGISDLWIEFLSKRMKAIDDLEKITKKD